MTPDEERTREEVAQRIERRADRYRNAGDEEGARRAEEVASQARAARTLAQALAVEAGLGAAGESPGIFGRFWRLLTGARDVSDDS